MTNEQLKLGENGQNNRTRAQTPLSDCEPQHTAVATTIEEIAAQHGYPPTFQGFTPRQRKYWQEPGLPWQPRTVAELAGITDRRGQPKVWRDFWFTSESMGPRFSAGTCVAIDPVHHYAELEVGRVYMRWARGADGTETWQCARLHTIGLALIGLIEDNGGACQSWPLRWDDQGDWCLYEVTHYVVQQPE